MGGTAALLSEITSPKLGSCDRLAWSSHAWCGAIGSPREASTSQARLHAMLTWLRERGAAAIPHAVGSFLDHLFGTWRILTAWGQPDDLRLCGLVHSVLSTDLFETPLVGPDAIPELRALVGDAALDLVLVFCTVDRLALAATCADLEALPAEGLRVTNFRTGERATLSAPGLADLLVIEMANEAEQSGSVAEGPAAWMALCAHLARLAGPLARRRPPIFDRCSSRLPPSAEVRAIERFRTLSVADPASNLEADVLEVCRLNRFAAEPKILFAEYALARRRFAEADGYAAAGLELLVQWGTPWDKRYPWEVWIARAGQVIERARAADPNGGG
jgi:hypothetical protein